jgi:endoglucanase
VDRRAAWLAVAERLLSRPTVPLVENRPAAHVFEAVQGRANLATTRDQAGNVVVRYHGDEGDAERPLVLVAHLDHPGFAVDGREGELVTLSFRGGLAVVNAVAGSPVHFFRPGDDEAVGQGELVGAEGDGARLTRARARVVEGEAAVGGFAMWGFPGFALEGGRICSRACDDLLGAAVVLCTLDELSRQSPPRAEVWGLFTRAEEIGFLGTLEAIRLGTVPPGARVLSLECSKALVDAPQGGGVIVRVGDRTSIFDPGLSEALAQAARTLASIDDGFRWQRKLMDAGTCEASAFCAQGWRASGLALPLGNYHNALDRALDGTPLDGPGIGPEHVAIDDYLAGVRLLVELATTPELLDEPTGPPAWLAERMDRARLELDDSGSRGGSRAAGPGSEGTVAGGRRA